MAKIKAADALLVIDIGNTRTSMAVCDEDGIHDVTHVPTADPDTWAPVVDQTWSACGGAAHRDIVIASVAPRRTEHMLACIDKTCGVDALVVRDDLPLPLELAIDNPREVGVDRICCAAAAYERTHSACAVASLGTATTIDCVSADGRFLGGAILPGVEMCFDMLCERTEQLPRAAYTAPERPFGRNTLEAINCGVVYGTLGALREIVERFATELSEWPRLVVTGGNAPVISRLSDFVDAVVPNLCLIGIALTHRRASDQR